MSADTSIRPVTIAEQARIAAKKFVETGEAQENPHIGAEDEQAWRSAYDRYILAISAAQDTEASA